MAEKPERVRYVGLNKRDIAACLRSHAQEISDGERARPTQAVVCDIDAETGAYGLMLYGTDSSNPREAVQVLTTAMQHITSTIAYFNAMASN